MYTSACLRTDADARRMSTGLGFPSRKVVTPYWISGIKQENVIVQVAYGFISANYSKKLHARDADEVISYQYCRLISSVSGPQQNEVGD